MARMAEDDIVQLIDDPRERTPEQGPRWKIAVIDDEPAVHDGTRFALSDYRLNGQGLEILSAYSAAEGRELMRRHADVRSEEHTSELQSLTNLVCRLLLEKK